MLSTLWAWEWITLQECRKYFAHGGYSWKTTIACLCLFNNYQKCLVLTPSFVFHFSQNVQVASTIFGAKIKPVMGQRLVQWHSFPLRRQIRIQEVCPWMPVTTIFVDDTHNVPVVILHQGQHWRADAFVTEDCSCESRITGFVRHSIGRAHLTRNREIKENGRGGFAKCLWIYWHHVPMRYTAKSRAHCVLTWDIAGKFKAAAILACMEQLQPKPMKASMRLSCWRISAFIDSSSLIPESSQIKLRLVPGKRVGSLLMLSTATDIADA